MSPRGRQVTRWFVNAAGRMEGVRETVYTPKTHSWRTCRAGRTRDDGEWCALYRRPVEGEECRTCERWQYKHARGRGCKPAAGITKIGGDGR